MWTLKEFLKVDIDRARKPLNERSRFHGFARSETNNIFTLTLTDMSSGHGIKRVFDIVNPPDKLMNEFEKIVSGELWKDFFNTVDVKTEHGECIWTFRLIYLNPPSETLNVSEDVKFQIMQFCNSPVNVISDSQTFIVIFFNSYDRKVPLSFPINKQLEKRSKSLIEKSLLSKALKFEFEFESYLVDNNTTSNN